MKARPYITERLLMGHKGSNKKNVFPGSDNFGSNPLYFTFCIITLPDMSSAVFGSHLGFAGYTPIDLNRERLQTPWRAPAFREKALDSTPGARIVEHTSLDIIVPADSRKLLT